jgi:uncharacterized protein GlcG (DUF336 family)
LVDGKIVGGIGVSGVDSKDDAQLLGLAPTLLSDRCD